MLRGSAATTQSLKKTLAQTATNSNTKKNKLSLLETNLPEPEQPPVPIALPTLKEATISASILQRE